MQLGPDRDGDGALDAVEVTATRAVCNGADGAPGEHGQDGVDGKTALVSTAPASVEACPTGGVVVSSGIDEDGSGALEPSEVQQTAVVCGGPKGSDGLSALLSQTAEPRGANCEDGGVRVEAGLDDDGNGALAASEVDTTTFVCKGAAGPAGQDGQNGTNGADGKDGLTALISQTIEPSGANCEDGGTRIDAGLDVDRNGELDAIEVDTTTYVCSSAGGGGCSTGYHLLSDGGCGRVLFSDNFDDGVIGGDWLPWKKTFLETAGRLNVGDNPRAGFNYGHSGNGRGASLATHVGDQTWTDYRVDLDLQALPPGAYNPYALPGCLRVVSLAFRVQQANESWNEPANTSYYIEMIPSYASCMGRQPGGVTLGSSHGTYFAGTGCCTVAAGSSRVLVSTTSPAFVDGPNHYSLEVKGNNIKLWVNEAPVFDYTDDTVPYAPGAVAIVYGGIEVSVDWELLGWVDNVVVTDMGD